MRYCSEAFNTHPMGEAGEAIARSILYVEDDLDYAFLGKRMLSNVFPDASVIHTASLAGAVQALSETTFDLVLCDLSLPDSQEMHGVHTIRQSTPDTPLVVLSGNKNDALAADAIRAGAQDFLCKDELTEFTLRRSLRFAAQRQGIKVEEESQRDRDSLTGLISEKSFLATLEGNLPNQPDCERRHQSKDETYVFYLDIDHFKTLNDELGHLAGDEAIKNMVSAVSSVLRNGDEFARLHGDEFAIALAADTDTEAETIAQRCLEAVRGQITLSIGIAKVRDTDKAADVIQRADDALYEAKKLGRDQHYIFDAALEAKKQTKAKRIARLETAVDSEGFCFFLQPVANVATGEVVSAEALIRFASPGRKSLSNQERHHLDVRGLWWKAAVPLLEELFYTCSSVHPDVWPQVTVNLASRDIRRPDMVPQILTALRNTNLPGSRLQLDVPADALSSGSVFFPLLERGVTLALNEFGVGATSLMVLGNAPCAAIKLAPQLVAGSGRSECGIFEGAVTLARKLGMETVAVGVESAAQLENARKLGCTAYQGNFLGQPMPTEEFLAWLNESRQTRTSRSNLKARFAARLPKRLARTLRAVEVYGRTPGDPECKKLALSELHRLAGATGAYGERALSEALRWAHWQVQSSSATRDVLLRLRKEQANLLG